MTYLITLKCMFHTLRVLKLEALIFEVIQFQELHLVSSDGGWEFEEEEATNIEWGYKMKSDRASFDFTYFTTEYDDLQTSVFDGVLGFKVGNASAAELDGFEMQGRYLLTDNLEFYASMASLDYKFTDWKNSQCAYGE